MRAATLVLASLALLTSPARADTVEEALEAYAQYQTDVSALLDADITNARDVDEALTRLSRHDGDRVARGWIAYGALTAAQSPAFANGVERHMREAGRAPMLSQLRADLYYARQQPAGSAQAVDLILATASADSARTAQAGARFDRFARSGPVTGNATSAASIRLSPEMRTRLRVTPLSSRPMSEIDDFGGRGFWDSLAGRDANAPRVRGGSEERTYASVTDHMLTLAAIVVAGETASERRRVAALLDEPLTQQCMEMQRLQLRQCLSVSVDGTERAYCLGHHALTGPGQCFANVVR